jgi:hypothetical protein
MNKLCSKGCCNEKSKFLRSKRRYSLLGCKCKQSYHVQCVLGLTISEEYEDLEFPCSNEACPLPESKMSVKDWLKILQSTVEDPKLIFMWKQLNEEEGSEEDN